MIRVDSTRQLDEMEAALGRAAQRHGAHIIAVTALRKLMSEEAGRASRDAVVFTVCHLELYGALLAADIRFAAFLPCRVAAISLGERVTLESLSPRHFCRLLLRSDLDRLVAPLETLLREVMEDAAAPATPPPPALTPPDAALGAREGQVSMRASLPQRIDCRGTKIEDLAGTGELDAPGG